MSLALAFVVSMAVAMSLLPVLVRLAGRFALLDQPGERKVHARPIPRVGGIAMAVGVLASTTSMMPGLSVQELGFLCAAALVVVLGAVDDRWDLDAKFKLAGQVAAAAIAVFLGGISISSLTLSERVVVPTLAGQVLTLVFLVGVTNAVNLADGLDGLAGGMSFICFCALAWLSQLAGQQGALTLSLAFAGAVIGFLRFNTHPAAVFMGDAGSQLLGFAAGCLGLLATQVNGTPVSTALPLLLLGIPILDTLQVMVRRLAAGRSPFSADKRHLHHQLLALGLHHAEAVAVLYALQGALFMTAYFLRFESDVVLVGLYVTFCGFVLGVLDVSQRMGLQVRGAGHGHAPEGPQRYPEWLARVRRSGKVLPATVATLGLLLTIYVAAVGQRVPVVPADLAVLLGLLLGAALATVVLQGDTPVTGFDRTIWYLLLSAAVYLDVELAPERRFSPMLEGGFLVAIALATATVLRLSSKVGVQVTPLDLIILFFALVAPNLPGIGALPQAVTLGVAKLVVGLYAVEVIAASQVIAPRWLRLAGLAWAAVVAWDPAMTFLERAT